MIEEGVPFIRATNLKNGKVNDNDILFIGSPNLTGRGMSLVPVSNEELGIKVKALDEDLKIIKFKSLIWLITAGKSTGSNTPSQSSNSITLFLMLVILCSIFLKSIRNC